MTQTFVKHDTLTHTFLGAMNIDRSVHCALIGNERQPLGLGKGAVEIDEFSDAFFV